MSNVFYIKEMPSPVYQNCFAQLQDMVKGGEVKISLSHAKKTRKLKQNKLMHLWISEFAMTNGYDLVHAGGLIKMMYFVPVILASETEEAQAFADVWHVIKQQRTYEQQALILGRSVIASTSILSTKAFAQGLTNVWEAEAANCNLTDPANHGLEEIKNRWRRS